MTDENMMLTDPLGLMVQRKFSEARAARRGKEDEWLKDLRQCRGKYEPEVEGAIGKVRSKAFARITRVKVRTMDARMANILFPSGRDKNWGIDPTPKPSVAPDVLQKAVLNAAQMQGTHPEELMQNRKAMELIEAAVAKECCRLMELEIEDQLDEGKYANHARQALHSGHQYGTGIIKGPLVDETIHRGWVVTESEATAVEEMKRKPWFEYVSIWGIYPDPEAVGVEDAEYVIHRHRMTRMQLRKLRDKGFDADKIDAHIAAHKNGDATMESFETDRRDITEGLDTVPNTSGRYDMLEYWGLVDGETLAHCGCKIPEERLQEDFEACIWVLGNMVIKASRNPFERQTKPFHLYRPEVDEASFWGISIPSNMRDSQSAMNAAWRATMDNAGVSVGPLAEVNLDLLEPGEDPTSIHSMRVFLRRGLGVEAQHPAVRFFTVPSHTRELLGLFDRAKQLADEESTIPSYMHGDADKGGAGNTMGGLSMLMGASNVTMGDAAHQFDSYLSKPFISAMYDWNMQFSENDLLRGDYEVIAKGSTTLMAKEIRSQQLMQMAQLSTNPAFSPYIDHYELIERIERESDMDGIVKEKEEIEQQLQAQQQQAAAGNAGVPAATSHGGGAGGQGPAAAEGGPPAGGIPQPAA